MYNETSFFTGEYDIKNFPAAYFKYEFYRHEKNLLRKAMKYNNRFCGAIIKKKKC